ncbi:MATE family efflux transporter [Planosporangium flavigriseum]|uniref:MATE family efflux transporter n=1 Tax=Planosporangium flavigriseum TaxID=373681 RepID=A0A8J3PK39_9ACTN|nr:MATE family efflux transporter [Planosporangium flavigriseum]NJC64065.1 MATE family efflux transporter [Planosporangium flavigriseum]GIG72946.1 MATE family efflux transporter [Planosporangium flavigriseum]
MTTSAAPAATPSLRKVAGLALPALAVLAAEPLYVLVDTAVVGHLGRTPLAALAIGGNVLTVAAWLGIVLAYGTTGRSARRYGAGDRAGAVAEGVQASWLAFAAGALIAVAAQVLADPLASTLAGNNPDVAAGAARWLRIAALGAPGLLLATAGNGWMRGVQDTRRPMYYVLGANLLSAIACPILVYGLHLGLIGSAIANAGAQTVSGALFVRALVVERVSLRPRPEVLRRQLVLGRDLLLRGAAFQACFISAAAVAARFGAAALAAHQVALQLWMFCAFALDAVAIAAQSLVGAALGAGAATQAQALARRIAAIGLASGAVFAVVIGGGAGVLPKLFSDDPQVFAQAMRAWPWFVGMLPLAGVVFALDGVLIGAGDVRYMRNLTLVSALCGFLPAIWIAYGLRLGLAGVWAGLALFIVIRLVGLLARVRSGRWVVVGVLR